MVALVHQSIYEISSMVRFYTCPSLLACEPLFPGPSPATKTAPDTSHQLGCSKVAHTKTSRTVGFTRCHPLVRCFGIDPGELSDVLGSAHGVLMTGGADTPPAMVKLDTARCGTIDLERDQIERRSTQTFASLFGHLPRLNS